MSEEGAGESEIVMSGEGAAIRATRAHAGVSRTHTTDVAQESSARSPEWTAFAGAQAWQEVGDELLGSDRPEDALAAAQNGIDELGDAYWDPLTIDDTKVKLRAAEDQRTGGNVREAAAGVLRVLASRIDQFLARQSP